MLRGRPSAGVGEEHERTSKTQEHHNFIMCEMYLALAFETHGCSDFDKTDAAQFNVQTAAQDLIRKVCGHTCRERTMYRRAKAVAAVQAESSTVPWEFHCGHLCSMADFRVLCSALCAWTYQARAHALFLHNMSPM